MIQGFTAKRRFSIYKVSLVSQSQAFQVFSIVLINRDGKHKNKRVIDAHLQMIDLGDLKNISYCVVVVEHGPLGQQVVYLHTLVA